ncbi:substrate-binding domain-containing protein [Streptomyces sp. NPDC059479]|uniref:substrate-binding domain-containing protein n=1 Tax=Streptomyces sp. NPDC059479 TaxID=3346848 RepID=UPI0036AA6557
MNVKFRIRMAAAAGAALGLSLLAAPASADPVDPTTGAVEFRQVVGVGSDTTQDVVNGLGQAIADPNNSPSPRLIASYNATGTTPIKTRAVNCSIQRPSSSTAGIDALRADLSALPGSATKNCIDFARSSRGPIDTSTNRLTWIPFARDAVTVAVRSDSALNDGVGFSTIQLRDIYRCIKTSHNGVPLTPLLPQAGSGTRTYFLDQIGVTGTELGACVGETAQPSDGTALDSAGDLAPYSIAQYIAQIGNVVPDRHGVTVLSRLNGVTPRIAGRLNAAFPFTRDVYNVVPTARLSNGATPDADLIRAFETITIPNRTADVCTRQAFALIERFGFAAIANCGNAGLQGER